MAQAIKLGPPDSSGTGWPSRAETRMIRGFSLLLGKYCSGVGNAEMGCPS
jgi:hypothetical protein